MDDEETGARDPKNEVNAEAFSPPALPAADSEDVSSGEARTINQVATAKWSDQVYLQMVEEFNRQPHVVEMHERHKATGNALPPRPPAPPTPEESFARIAAVLEKFGESDVGESDVKRQWRPEDEAGYQLFLTEMNSQPKEETDWKKVNWTQIYLVAIGGLLATLNKSIKNAKTDKERTRLTKRRRYVMRYLRAKYKARYVKEFGEPPGLSKKVKSGSESGSKRGGSKRPS